MVLQPWPPSPQQAAYDGLTLVAAETLRHRREPGQLLFVREGMEAARDLKPSEKLGRCPAQRMVKQLFLPD